MLQNLEQLVILYLQSRTEKDEYMNLYMLACLLSCLWSVQLLYSYTCQDTLSREWWHPQWAERSHINKLIAHRHASQPTQCRQFFILTLFPEHPRLYPTSKAIANTSIIDITILYRNKSKCRGVGDLSNSHGYKI